MTEKEIMQEIEAHIDFYGKARRIDVAIIGLLDLYNKLKEELVELKEEIEDWKFTSKYVEDNYISKDKIKDKIKELEEKDKASSTNIYGYGIKFLKELLGE